MSKNGEWDIVYFKSSNGSNPIYDFIESLNTKAKAKILNTFDLLTEYGTRLGLPHVKKVTGTKLWELRILGSDSIRVFHVATPGRVFLLLHGFIKKSQKTPNKEIKIALTRLKEHQSRRS